MTFSHFLTGLQLMIPNSEAPFSYSFQTTDKFIHKQHTDNLLIRRSAVWWWACQVLLLKWLCLVWLAHWFSSVWLISVFVLNAKIEVNFFLWKILSWLKLCFILFLYRPTIFCPTNPIILGDSRPQRWEVKSHVWNCSCATEQFLFVDNKYMSVKGNCKGILR